MLEFLQSIKYVTGPLTLIAFLAVIFLAIYRRSVDDKKGLEYLYALFSHQLTKNHFYTLAAKIINRIFASLLVILILAFSAWAFAKWLDAPNRKQLEASKLEITNIGFTHDSEFDVTVRNLGEDAIVINRIMITLVKDHGMAVSPMLQPSATYKIPVDGLKEGESKSLDTSHVIEEHKADRFLIALETTSVYTLKVTLFYNQSDAVSFERRTW